MAKIPKKGPGIAINDRLKSFKNVYDKKSYKNLQEYVAVDKINFEIEKNETVGLLGPNGCGKTTTIGMMLGLVAPSEVEILIENKNINLFKRDEILKRFNFASPYVVQKNSLLVRILKFMEGFMVLKI